MWHFKTTIKLKQQLFILTTFLVLTAFTASAQKLITLDSTKISHEAELNFSRTAKRGIETEAKIVYFVEKDLQTLTAYQNGLVKWKVNIIQTCGKPAIGQSTIRYIRLDNNTISVTFGKHNYASVDINNGKTTFLGAD